MDHTATPHSAALHSVATDGAPAHVRALRIPADATQPVVVEPCDVSAAGLVDAVGGGQPEPVRLGDGVGAVMYCNEYGKALHLAPNGRANRLLGRLLRGFTRHDLVAGPIIVIGQTADGRPADVPDHIVAAIGLQ